MKFGYLELGEIMDLNEYLFDCYCYAAHEEFMTVEEKEVSSLCEELGLFKGGKIDVCAY